MSQDEQFNEIQKDSYDDEKFNGMEFDWEGAFGNLTNEDLRSMQGIKTMSQNFLLMNYHMRDR